MIFDRSNALKLQCPILYENLYFTFHLKVLLVIFMASALSCTENAKKEKNTNHTISADSIFTISLEDRLNHQRVIGLKEMAAEIQYIKLEFTPECALGKIANYFFKILLFYLNISNCAITHKPILFILFLLSIDFLIIY